ncbi:MAG: glycosyltransferase family 2 protein [Leptospira sp.]|nr:glycosyltransferase family 2 protein [Leptospira sp.]
MKAKPYISLVLPVYNEKENLPLLYEAVHIVFKQHGYSYELIFVNDGSRDGSEEEIRKIAKSDKKVKGIFFRKNFGQSAATSAGIHQAKGDIIVIMDTDLQNDPNDIPLLIQKIEEGNDIVSGWRKNRKDNAIIRNFPSKIANWLIQRIGKVPIHDLGCSLKAYRSEIIKEVNLYGEMHRFIAIYAYYVGAKISEVEVRHHARQFGESKYGLNRVFKVLVDLITLKYMLSYANKPIYFFGKIASYFFGLGTISFFGLLIHKFGLGTSFIQSPLTILTPFLFVTGMNVLLFGLVAELLMRIYHESQNKPVYYIKEIIN